MCGGGESGKERGRELGNWEGVGGGKREKIGTMKSG